MRFNVSTIAAVLVVTLLAAIQAVSGQGVTSGAITGTITGPQSPVAGAQVQIINRSTGYSSGTLTRSNGLYLAQGLEVGGPYTVRVSSIGFQTVERNDVYVTLSASTRIDFQLAERAVELAALEITTSRTADFSPSRQGVSNVVTDSLLRRLPSVSRDILDMVKLTPQVVRPADTNGGPSAGGQYNRFNNFTIDGASAADRFNLNASGGAPGSSAGARLVSVDAVKEFRVAMTPTDVRQGNFTGMLLNAVTKSGTNEYHGGGTFVFRNQSLASKIPFITPVAGSTPPRSDTTMVSQPDQTVKQFGFSVGGPLIRDRLHFFIAPEIQQRFRPAAGPYAGGTGGSAPNVSQDSIATIQQLVQGIDLGGIESVELDNPLTNLFARLDYAASANHRVVLRTIYNRADDNDFFRNTTPFNGAANAQNSGTRLTSNKVIRVHRNFSVVGQLYSNLSNGWSNELIVGYNKFSDVRETPVRSPEISVGVTPIGGTAPTAAVTFGTEQFSPGNTLRETVMEAVNNLTIPVGAHTVTVGARAEVNNMFNFFAQRLYGVWSFPNIAALRNRTPSGYSVAFANSGVEKDIGVEIKPALYSVYAQDQWAVTDRLTLTYGLRADLPSFLNEPANNPRVTAAFDTTDLGRSVNTSALPKTSILWSPRLGFNYDPTGDQKNQIRGNIGIFTGPPPFILVGNAYANNALGLVTLTCTATTGGVPAFTTNVDQMARACGTQTPAAPGQSGTAGINVNDPNFKYPQYYVASFGFDRQLPYAMVLSLEGIYRKARNGVLIRDLNLKGPREVSGAAYTDREGRVLYADTISATGGVTNTRQRHLTGYQGTNNFSEGLIEVTNQSEDYNYTLSAQLRKRFSNAIEGTVAYTYLQSKDVQSLTSDRAISNFRNGRQLSTSHDEIKATTSVFERPHRFIAYGTFTMPWKSTDLSLYFEAVSGAPITYTVNNDVNGDLVVGNDPIYIPRSATDANEMRFATPAEATAFENFINEFECLDKQRGNVMERDSCYAPFQKRMDLSIRQTLPQVRGQRITLQLDVFNFLNLLNDDWGRIELPTLSPNFPQQAALRVVSRTAGPLNQSYNVYGFSSDLINRGTFVKSSGGSNGYQMQLTLRYSF